MRGISTVLLVDTVESTAASSRLGQERGQQIAARTLDTLRSAVAAHDGRV